MYITTNGKISQLVGISKKNSVSRKNNGPKFREEEEFLSSSSASGRYFLSEVPNRKVIRVDLSKPIVVAVTGVAVQAS